MIRVESIETWGFEHAVRGMRNPMNSWERSDSYWTHYEGNRAEYILGDNDLKLMTQLAKAGTEHRKYLRQIFISMDIVAPLYWWKEFDTYKVGTVANSCSTMHKIHSKRFDMSDFSFDKLESPVALIAAHDVVNGLNVIRDRYLSTKDKQDWYELIQLLPSSYNQRRTVTMNYENALTIIHQRSNHKLDEWCELCEVLSELPYIGIIGDI